MKEKIKQIIQHKAFHISILVSIVVILLFILLVVVLRYQEKGETNMPFIISKIAVISTSEGIDKENAENKWDFMVDQNNDIYIYIEKNNNYKKTEIIESIVLNNFSFEKQSDLGEVNVYRPDEKNENVIFKTSEENKVDEIEYIGDVTSEIKSLKMSNQGDMIPLRIANHNIKEYISDDEEIINHTELLKKLNLSMDDLKIKAEFDLTINLNSGKSFKTRVSVNLPVENVIDEGTTSTEITDTNKFIFKRVRN